MATRRQGALAAEVAEVLAIQALAFIAEDGERLGRFLALTGMGPAELRAGARDRHFLAGVLDYLAGDEALLIAFANQAGVEPTNVVVAQQALAAAGEPDAGD
jgi:hypothetical protein